MEIEWIQPDLVERDQPEEPDELDTLAHGSSRLSATDHEYRGGPTMDCVSLRHGIAMKRDEWERPDTDRPLTERKT
jgi:hypothetical protein